MRGAFVTEMTDSSNVSLVAGWWPLQINLKYGFGRFYLGT